jgi:hypothetical protein
LVLSAAPSIKTRVTKNIKFLYIRASKKYCILFHIPTYPYQEPYYFKIKLAIHASSI